MDYLTLKALHVAGVIGLFTSFGATILAGSGKKSATMLHGISMVLILLVGFAMLKKPPMDQYWWMAKLVIWLGLGAAPALAKRKVMPTTAVLILSIAVGILAAWLGIRRPF